MSEAELHLLAGAGRAGFPEHSCEPENRLVARSLDSRWEQRLVALAETEKALADTHAFLPALPSRAELEALTADMAGLWHAPTTSSRDRKPLLRTLIADVTLLAEPDFAKARVGIRWHTGASDEITLSRRQNVTQSRNTDPAAIDTARQLGELTNDELARRLNAAGYVTGAGQPFDRVAVTNMRHYHHIPQPGLLHDGETTVADIARHLGISHGAVIAWIARGWLPARRGLNDQWCVPVGPDTEAACRARVALSAHIHARRGPAGRFYSPSAPMSRPPAEPASPPRSTSSPIPKLPGPRKRRQY